MIPVYNFLQFILLVIGFPVILALVWARKKYRNRIGQRLGFGLHGTIDDDRGSREGKSIWIHCLSVGEVTSAVPFIKALRRRLPDARFILTVATATGQQVAEKRIGTLVDVIMAGPLDLRPTVRRFIRHIDPDLFILVETDFWPNWLDRLGRLRIPVMLINGRISAASFNNYRKLRFFFAPLFQKFSLLAMQTGSDAEQIRDLGASPDRVMVLGNLKYDTVLPVSDPGPRLNRSPLRLVRDSIIWICGSTHAGEEEQILTAFSRLGEEFPRLALVIAPRNPGRAREIIRLAREKGLQAVCRTTAAAEPTRLLVLDTIGELTECYRLAHVAFIGGSLVDQGGHNPLEAAAFGVPTLFGPHMEDFHEIADDLVRAGGGRTVRSAAELTEAVRCLLLDLDLHHAMSKAAADLIASGRGVVDRHVDAAMDLLNPS
ncbi:MAG: 3-deoxy-D-manno-octulosonic acid transferase [Desulfobulbaceae bacterium]|jgi:3-deoxy-D-manno-octulosonic-acid transferase|nr:3-deoxy-D-manno-octulosonic acid transferase [Desulfobulbaceae bacterium]